MATYLLREAGHDLVGFTLRLWCEPSSKSSDQHIRDARRVADALGIEHRVVDLTAAFESTIVAPFVNSYMCGQTPSPCIRCNALVKFGLLRDVAAAAGCEAVATGHYVRRVENRDGRLLLQRGADAEKDQSYFLFALSQNQLRQARFPLGDLRKEDVRTTAAALGLVPHEKSESQDLCFIPDGNYQRFIARRHPERCRPGPIIDRAGRELGRHSGFFRYTIGQRRGLGLGGGPWYVLDVRPASNTVVVGRREDTFAETAQLHDVNWLIQPPPPGTRLTAAVQLRYAMTPVRAEINVGDQGRAALSLARPVAGVTPGRAMVS